MDNLYEERLIVSDESFVYDTRVERPDLNAIDSQIEARKRMRSSLDNKGYGISSIVKVLFEPYHRESSASAGQPGSLRFAGRHFEFRGTVRSGP